MTILVIELNLFLGFFVFTTSLYTAAPFHYPSMLQIVKIVFLQMICFFFFVFWVRIYSHLFNFTLD